MLLCANADDASSGSSRPTGLLTEVLNEWEWVGVGGLVGMWVGGWMGGRLRPPSADPLDATNQWMHRLHLHIVAFTVAHVLFISQDIVQDFVLVSLRREKVARSLRALRQLRFRIRRPPNLNTLLAADTFCSDNGNQWPETPIFPVW